MVVARKTKLAVSGSKDPGRLDDNGCKDMPD